MLKFIIVLFMHRKHVRSKEKNRNKTLIKWSKPVEIIVLLPFN